MKCPKCETFNPADSKFCKECATPLPGHVKDRVSFTRTLETTPDELPRGMLFAGRYEIIEELGTGGMGRVYRAQDTKLNEEVALKLIRPEFGADKRTADRFHNEIKIARKISHKNVCRTHDLHEEGRTLYLTMEYVRGEDLKSLIKRTHALTVGTSVSIAHQVAEGLAEAHKLGIVHRDLKPGNIMIDKEGQAKIMDFGIARAMAEKGMTGAGAIVGTPEYMSPEQVEGKEADQRADIYALGVILFEMVTGQVPFDGETPFSIANKHKSEPPPNPKKLMPQIPDGLSRLILRCLEKDKAKRYQTAEELLADLGMVEAALPATERTSFRAPSRTRPRASRDITVKLTMKKWLVPAAAVVFLAVGGYFISRPRAAPPASAKSPVPRIAILDFENISKDPKLDVWARGAPALLNPLLNQSRFLRVLSEFDVRDILRRLGLDKMEKYSADDLKRIAAEIGATHLLAGNYLPVSTKIVFNLSLIDGQTGAALRAIQAEAPDEDAISASVNEMAKKIKSGLDIDEPDVDEKVYKMASDAYPRNPKALREYLIAVQLYDSGDWEGGISAMERAVALDPRFAGGFMRLCGWYQNQGHPLIESYQAALTAFQLRDTLTEYERLKVEAFWLALQEKSTPKAHAILHKLVELQPDDTVLRGRLALTSDDPEEVIREQEHIVFGQNIKAAIPINNLTRAYCWYREDYRKARELWESVIPLFPLEEYRQRFLARLFVLEGNLDMARRAYEKYGRDWPDPHCQLAMINDVYFYVNEDPDRAREMIERLRRAKKDPQIEAGVLRDYFFRDYFLVKGKFGEAFALIDEAEKDRETLFELARRDLQAGRPAFALKKLDAALESIARQESQIPADVAWKSLVERKREALIWQVCALCGIGRIDEAAKLAERIEKLIPENISRIKSERRRVGFHQISELPAGEIALAKKDAPRAIEYLERSLRLMIAQEFMELSNHAYVLDRLGEAYQLGGDPEKAAQAFDRIPGLFTGRMEWPVVYARSYYKAGKALEQLGKKGEARARYTRFLSLWKDADLGLPEVEDAKKRLAAL